MIEVPQARRRAIIVTGIILAAVLIRSYNINGALFDFNPLRQAMGTAIARNYAQNLDARFLFPQVDNEGAAPGYFMFELPIIPYAVSFLVGAVGAENWVFRLPIIILFAFSAIYFYKLCSLIADFRTASLALIFYCIAPISILMGRVFQAESFILLAMLSSIYYLIRWFEEQKTVYLLACTLAITVLLLLKITNLYIFLLIAALFLIYKKIGLIPRFILPMVFVIAVNFWWWGVHSAAVREAFPTQYTFVAGDQYFGAKYLLERLMEFSFSPGYWALISRQIAWIIFSPAIFILLLIGVFVRKERKISLVLLAWAAAVFVFIFAVPGASVQDYYKIHFLPAGAILAAIGYLYIFDRLRFSLRGKLIIVALWFLVLANIFLIVFPIIRYKPIFEYQQVLGKKVEEMTKKEDLVLASYGPDAMLLYYCNRKGWNQYLPAKQDNIGLLERRREMGAKYFVCGNLDELDSDPEFKEYLLAHYKLTSGGDRSSGEPKKGSVEHFVWKALGAIGRPFAEEFRKKLEQRSLGYVIFDLRRKF